MTVFVAITWIAGALPPSDCATLAPPSPPIELEAVDGLILTCVDYVIDGSVKPEALDRALRAEVGAPLDVHAWRRDLQLLRNLGIFRRLDTEVLRVEGDTVAVRLHVRNAWSLLPFFGFEGGAVPIVMIGGYYANLFGEMIETGAYYMRRGPYDLGRVWLTMPHWVWPRSLFEIQLVTTGELRPDYPGPRGWRLPRGGREIMRRGAYTDFGWQPFPDRLTLSVRYAYLRETAIQLDNLPAVVDAGLRGRDVPEVERGAESNADLSIIGITALFGQVDLVDNFLWRGKDARLVLLGSSDLIGSDRDFALMYLTARSFTELGGGLELGVRLTAARSTSPHPNDDFVLGGHNLEPFVYNSRLPGLLSVRGVRPGQFHGRQLAFANIEPRYTLLRDVGLGPVGGISLQLAAFVDAGRAWDGKVRRLFEDGGLAAGGGLLLTLLDFRYTYVNWYVARVFSPLEQNVFSVVVTRPFF